MKLKHKVIKEFQYLSPDKKIFILKVNTILEEYVYKVKSELIPIDKDIIDNNPDFFEIVDWKSELVSYLRVNKLPQPAVLSKKLFPFMEEFILSSSVQSEPDLKSKDLDNKEFELNRREKRLIEKEDEIEIRVKRVEKRELEYKEDLSLLDKKEQDLKSRLSNLYDKELDLQQKEQELNKRERNIESEILEASKNIDIKYTELKNKIDTDISEVNKKEELLEKRFRELKILEDSVDKDNLDVQKYSKYLEDIISWKNSIEIYLPDKSHYSIPDFPSIEKKTF